MNMNFKGKTITLFIFFAVIAANFYFGFSRLKNFSGVDEPYWSYGRVPTFWKAVKTMNWKKTNISDKPGVPLAIVSGVGLPFISANPKDYKALRYEPKTPEQLQKIRDIYFYLRLPIFLFTLATLPLFYSFIKKFLGKNIARFSLIFLGLSPILLGISLIINSDALLWILTALATLSLFVFFEKKEKKYLLLSGFFLGLSVITKYVANILFVYFFLLFLLEYIFQAHRETSIEEYLKQALFNYILLFITALLVAFVFFPATWVKLSVLWNATLGNKVFSLAGPFFAGMIIFFAFDILALKARFSKIIFDFLVKYKKIIAKISAAFFLFFAFLVFLHIWTPLKIFDLQKIIASPKGIGKGGIFFKFWGAFLADFFSLLFSVSPLILLLVLFAGINIFRKKDLGRETITAVYILLFIFLYYLGSTANGVIATVRYQIMVYPLIFVLAAIGISQFFEIDKVKKNITFPAVLASCFLLLLASLYFVKPHFLAYASEILPKNYVVNLKEMGEGSYEAASYLNKLPNAQEMKIWSDKGAVCEAFVGKCFIDFKSQVFEENRIDYFVISTDRRSRSLKRTGLLKEEVDIKKLYESNNYVFEAIIANNPNNFVRIYPAEEFLKKNDER
jgi:4-amino-4-deoxy-L-arabinose transferase-like glycosyltransferase